MYTEAWRKIEREKIRKLRGLILARDHSSRMVGAKSTTRGKKNP